MEYRAFRSPLLGAEHIFLSKILANVAPYPNWNAYSSATYSFCLIDHIKNSIQNFVQIHIIPVEILAAKDAKTPANKLLVATPVISPHTIVI